MKLIGVVIETIMLDYNLFFIMFTFLIRKTCWQ